MASPRVVLKVSGESLQGQRDSGIDPNALNDIARQIVECRDRGVEMGVVVGGGNLFRGRLAAELGMAEATAHYAGMLATVINGLALQDAIEAAGGEVRTMSALQVRQVSEIFIRRRALRHLEKGRIVLCVGGTGNPYVTTDTAAALRGIELDADQLLMGKHGTDGVYTADPALDSSASRYAQLNYRDALQQNLGVLMDASALALCEEHSLPIVVFNIESADAIVRTVIDGPDLERAGTLVDHGETRLAG
ncbi:MAG: UMP kinase [Chloroflexi bacterium]|nr:UMP kinase [Chloroflexota bacterium]MYD16042.1 UMP kinase [Chloroflexota bacterium]MYJ01908.1 UMP kinase [Chloroflexota bacterium]